MLALLWIATTGNAAVDVVAKRSFAEARRAASLERGGLWLAYAVRSKALTTGQSNGLRYTATGMLPESNSGTELRVSNTRTGALTVINEDQGSITDPVWSPDGVEVAYYSDRGGTARTWIWNKLSQQSRQVSDAIARPSFHNGASLKWTPDNKYVIALVLPKGMTVEQANERAQGNDSSADLALIDVVTGDARRLTREKNLFWYAPSPDGKWVAYSYSAARTNGGGRKFQLEVASTETASSLLLADAAYAADGICTWSPDSTRLAYFALGTGGKDGVHIVDVTSKSDRAATSITFSVAGPEDAHRRVYWTPDGSTVLFIFNGRLWSATPQNGEIMTVTAAEWNRQAVQIVERGQSGVVWTRDNGRSVTVTTRDLATGNMGFYRIEIATGKATRLREDARRYGDHSKPAIASDDGTFVIWAAEGSNVPMDLWGAGPNLKEAIRLTTLNP